MITPESPLRKLAFTTLDQAAAQLAGEPLTPARLSLASFREQFAAKMRVALIGRVSSGKSTLVNALLGGHVVATGVEELTYNVNWLEYAAKPAVTVYFKDHRLPIDRSLADLEALTVRSETDKEFLASIDYLRIGYPNDYLRAFDLVDTPGLDSYFREDSANTLRFLGKADALVLVFARGESASEEELLRDFHGSGLTSIANPLSAVGVLTKIEFSWDPDRPDTPAEIGRRIAGRLMTEGGARRYLYDLYPLASLVGEAAATLSAADFADLTELAAIDRDVLLDALSFGRRFSHDEDPGLRVPPDRRFALFSRLSGYGIALACQLVADGVDDLPTLRAELEDRSGMTAFRRSLTDHFGSRSDLIKLQRLASQARSLPEAKDGLAPRDSLTVREAVALITDLEVKELKFSEIVVLRDFYEGRLELSAEDAADLKRITGELGQSAAARLGLPEQASQAELRARAFARHSYWSGQAVEAFAGPRRRAVWVLQRSYEDLIASIEKGTAK